jgi:hypothetical protein
MLHQSPTVTEKSLWIENELALVEIRDGIFLASGKPQLQMPKGLHRIHLLAYDFDRMKFLGGF